MSDQQLTPTSQEIGVRPTQERSLGRWDKAEQAAKILSFVAIPVMIAIVGWLLQDTLNKRIVSQEYVSLAVSILREREVDPGLRTWAVDLLNRHAPIQFAPEVSQRLRQGVLTLPVSASLRRAMSEADVEQIVREILDGAGLVPNFTLVKFDVPTVAAKMQDGKRVLLYNPGFVQSLNRNPGLNWAAVAVLAHEIGHHLMGHLLSNKVPAKPLELEADYYAGFMLRRLGATLDEAIGFFKTLPEESPTHGSRSERIRAVRSGWEKAQSGGSPSETTK